MRIVAGLLILFCLASGCSDKDRIPSDIIPREEMGKILWDMIQADQYSSMYLAKDSLSIGMKEPVATSGQHAVTVNGKNLPPIIGKNPAPVPHKDSARIRQKQDSLRAIQQKESLRIGLQKDSFRLGLKMKDLALYQRIFQLHDVSRDEFRKSFQFYLDHPDIAKTLVDSMLAKGNRLRMESYNTAPTHVDSLKKQPVVLPGTPPGVRPITPGAGQITPGFPGAHPGIPPGFPRRPDTTHGAKLKPPSHVKP